MNSRAIAEGATLGANSDIWGECALQCDSGTSITWVDVCCLQQPRGRECTGWLGEFSLAAPQPTAQRRSRALLRTVVD